MSFIRHDKDYALNQMKKLVFAFNKNLKYYKSQDYLQANIRKQFVDKMLIILNWDVNNQNQVAPQYKQVVLEARTNVTGVIKHPDYAICFGGKPVFFVEAKPASTKILNADKHALQLKKYSFSAKKGLSILTNFAQFSVYDTRKKPQQEETADKSRVKYLKFDEYVDNFDYLWNVFSYDSVIKGSVDNYFNKFDGNYAVNDVDMQVLEAIQEWRFLFVKGLKNKDGKLTQQNVNTAVQKLINRIVYTWRTKGY